MSKNKKSVIFIRDKHTVPSSVYRFLQYLPYLEAYEFKIFSYTPKILIKPYNALPQNSQLKKSLFKIILYFTGVHRTLFFILYDMLYYKADNLIVIRRFFPRKIPFWGTRLLKKYLKNKKVYWDFDDNIIYDKEIVKKEAEILQKEAIKISVTSSFLKKTILPRFQNKVVLLPTTDITFAKTNITRLINERMKSYNEEINICWIGTKGNLMFLDDVIEFIENAARECTRLLNKKMKLYIVSNGNLNYNSNYLKIHNIKWSPEASFNIISQSHIGIMPMPDNEYTRGKAGFKAVQYISSGLPSIASNVGFNNDVIKDGYNGIIINHYNDWQPSILSLSKNPDIWKNKAINARKMWEQKFNSATTIDYWRDIFNS